MITSLKWIVFFPVCVYDEVSLGSSTQPLTWRTQSAPMAAPSEESPTNSQGDHRYPVSAIKDAPLEDLYKRFGGEVWFISIATFPVLLKPLHEYFTFEVLKCTEERKKDLCRCLRIWHCFSYFSVTL